jgi:DNA-binding CsgD family transcriptional regulator
MEADLLLPRGDWRGCTKALRVALAAGAGQLYDTITRLIAARLACLQGRTVESYAHLARAEELYAELAAAGNTEYDAVRAEVAAAAGDTDAAVGAALAGLHANLAPTGAERLLPTAARALADRAGRLRDHGFDPGDALNELDELRARYPVVRGEDGGGPEYAAVRQAMQVVYDTECARAHAADPQWTDAGDACQVAGLPWEEAYCRWRLAEAAATRRPARQATRDAVHRAYGLASDLQAVPLMTELETLAASARIPLRFAAEPVPAQRGLTDRLTAREREVLGHLVAGRTYAEIAAVLVLSEKTVSVHVSNMLRKTGSANRVELIRRAGRTIIARTRPA